MTVPNTKIVATLGPATDPPGVLGQLLAGGVDVFRLNASHGTQLDHAARISAVRALAQEAGVHPAILLDLQGPKIRLGRFAGGGCMLANGAAFTITTEPVSGSCDRASTGYADFARDVRPGDRILLADGTIELRAVSSDGVAVTTEVISGGPVSDHKGINLPGVRVSIPSLTAKDLADLDFGLSAGVDLVALSFVRTASDVQMLRDRMSSRPVPIVAKIEKPEAWDNIESILNVTDGVMVARGDLGVELPPYAVPPLQKRIVETARRLGKPVVVATQMLESMITAPTPTRAEVSDVATAVYDGADAVMLSAETAAGEWPEQAVAMMNAIAHSVERDPGYLGRLRYTQTLPDPTTSDALAEAAQQITGTVSASVILCYTSSGSTVRRVARERPEARILALTPRQDTARRMGLLWGAHAVRTKDIGSFEEMIAKARRMALRHDFARAGDKIIVLAGVPFGTPGSTNVLHVATIRGDELKGHSDG